MEHENGFVEIIEGEPRLWERGLPGFPGHLRVTEVTAGARAPVPCEACHPLC